MDTSDRKQQQPEEEKPLQQEEQPRQSSIGTEPRTLYEDEMRRVKDVVTDVFHSADSGEQALELLSNIDDSNKEKSANK